MKKRKIKKFETGGVLRDRYGNPVRSGSGEVVGTTFPARSYNEQASDAMTESSDYSGRGARSMESSQRFPRDDAGIESRRQTSDYSSESNDTSPSLTERLSTASSGSNIRRMDGEGGYTSPVKESKSEASKKSSATKTPPAKSPPAKSPPAKADTERGSKPYPTDTAAKAKVGAAYEDVTKRLKEAESKKSETDKPKKRGGIGPYHAFESVTDYFSKLREGRKRPGEMKKGGAVKKYASGGSVSSASKRADGIAQRGKTKGRIC